MTGDIGIVRRPLQKYFARDSPWRDEFRMPIEELSLQALRARALQLGWLVRRVAGGGFVILNRYRNLATTGVLDTSGLRQWLIDTLAERRRAYYW